MSYRGKYWLLMITGCLAFWWGVGGIVYLIWS